MGFDCATTDPCARVFRTRSSARMPKKTRSLGLSEDGYRDATYRLEVFEAPSNPIPTQPSLEGEGLKKA